MLWKDTFSTFDFALHLTCVNTLNLLIVSEIDQNGDARSYWAALANLGSWDTVINKSAQITAMILVIRLCRQTGTATIFNRVISEI